MCVTFAYKHGWSTPNWSPLALPGYFGQRRNKLTVTNTLAYHGTKLFTSVKSFHGKDSGGGGGGVGVMMDGVRFNDFISNEITSNDATPRGCNDGWC